MFIVYWFGLWVVNRGRMTIGLVSCRGYGFDAARICLRWSGSVCGGLIRDAKYEEKDFIFFYLL